MQLNWIEGKDCKPVIVHTWVPADGHKQRATGQNDSLSALWGAGTWSSKPEKVRDLVQALYQGRANAKFKPEFKLFLLLLYVLAWVKGTLCSAGLALHWAYLSACPKVLWSRKAAVARKVFVESVDYTVEHFELHIVRGSRDREDRMHANNRPNNRTVIPSYSLQNVHR